MQELCIHWAVEYLKIGFGTTVLLASLIVLCELYRSRHEKRMRDV